jgi:hypothetical protein
MTAPVTMTPICTAKVTTATETTAASGSHSGRRTSRRVVCLQRGALLKTKLGEKLTWRNRIRSDDDDCEDQIVVFVEAGKKIGDESPVAASSSAYWYILA